MGEVIRLDRTGTQLDTAWEAFDAAQRRVMELYRDPESKADDRRHAVLEANRLHAMFRKLSEAGPQ